jgi:hypothetical protein
VELFPLIWALLAAVLLALEIMGRLGLFGLAPLGPTLAVLRRRPLGRAALVVAWMWLGWHLFAR